MNAQFESIADGLAEKGFAVIDQFLSQSEVGDILKSESFENASHNFQKAGIGKHTGHQINEAIRGDYIHWLDRNNAEPSILLYLNRLQELITFLNQALYLSLKDCEVHTTVYPSGSYYKRHLDQFKHDDHRKLSVICYLNNNWDESNGGQLRMFLPDGAKDILPLAGRLVCFRSDQIEHEVRPANRERLSLTGWILDQYADLKFVNG
jgi:SM-20-related protein